MCQIRPRWFITQLALEKEAQNTCHTGRMHTIITNAKNAMLHTLKILLPVDLFLTIAIFNFPFLFRIDRSRCTSC